MCRNVVSAFVDVTSRRAERTKTTTTVLGPIISTMAATVVGDLVDDINSVLQAAGVKQLSTATRDAAAKSAGETTKYVISTFSDLSTTIASTVSGATKAYLA